jgi:histidine triad (HIT) family protein
VWRDAETTAFISPRWWPGNPAHVIVIPNDHFANLDEIPEPALAAVYATAKRIALALKGTRDCDGTSTRQHNGSGAGQDVFHFHVHVFPRFTEDGLYARDAEFRWSSPEERAPYAERLREALG